MTQTFEEWFDKLDLSVGGNVTENWNGIDWMKHAAQAAWNARPSLPEIEGDDIQKGSRKVVHILHQAQLRGSLTTEDVIGIEDFVTAAITRLKGNPWTPIGWNFNMDVAPKDKELLLANERNNMIISHAFNTFDDWRMQDYEGTLFQPVAWMLPILPSVGE